MKAGRGLVRPPVLAMVDAFVGGTAILLILIILSSNLQEQPGTQPQADVVLRCDDGTVTGKNLPEWMPPMDALPPAEAAAWVAEHPPKNRLLTRIRLELDQREFRCASRFQEAATAMNDLSDDINSIDTLQERAILLLNLVILPQQDPPE